MNRFNTYLQNLGFSEKELPKELGNVFSYKLGSDKVIYFVYTANNEDIFTAHHKFWNNNNINIFIAASSEKTYIINAKQKPDKENPLAKQIAIKSFDYGVNSEGYAEEKVKEITKAYIDSTYFFNFIVKLTVNKKKQEVDKHLLLNLIALRNDLLEIENDEETIHLLILRSLFIKYLEDKGIYEENYWASILSKQSPKEVLEAFDEIKKINGNIFDEDLLEEKLKIEYIQKLHRFFISDYRTGQQSFFPYLFDKIPVQLISHVYEAFLKSKDKKGKGIYYTPSFVVNFMLSHSLTEKLKSNTNITILDPAMGSGAFLVESLKMIIQNNPELTYEQKKEILQKQLFGIDIDRKALQIAVFSLYLTLIETEKPEFIREQIENSHPILPSLIGENLICANALTDEVFAGKTFDCILSNPPWGSAEPNGDNENIKEREAISTKGKNGTMPEYKNVADFERSQAFLVRVKKWSNENTIFSLIVKNSIFLNDNSEDFRKELLNTYQINTFYELSNYNKILFKKQLIGEKPLQIELGASEPCAILVFELPKTENHTIKYISPKLNGFSENFQLIHYTQKDINEVEQKQFIEDDLLWRVLVNGDFEDYKLINNKLTMQNGFAIECRSGFKAQSSMKPQGKPDYRDLIEHQHFIRYKIIGKPHKFNFNQDMERKRDKRIFEGTRLIFPNRPLKQFEFRLKCVDLHSNEIHKDGISCIRIKINNDYVNDYSSFLGVFNSKLVGYYIYQISSQWDTGEEKREKIKNSDIEKIHIQEINQYDASNIKEIVLQVKSVENDMKLMNFEAKLDELVFDLYDLKEYQKEIIREFYQIRVERADKKLKYVQPKDIKKYIEEFAKSFNLMLNKGSKLVGKYKISANVGAVVCFTIVDEKDEYKPAEDKTLEILHFVKNKQITEADHDKILNEDKVQIYDNEFMYIIKSNQFKDWTVRQAMKDAKEEIGLLLSKLPKR